MPPNCNALYILLGQVERLYYSNHLLRSRTCTTLTSDKTNFCALENTSLSLEVLPWEPIIHYWAKSVRGFAWLIYICSIHFSYCFPRLVQTRGLLSLRLREWKRQNRRYDGRATRNRRLKNKRCPSSVLPGTLQCTLQVLLENSDSLNLLHLMKFGKEKYSEN